VTEASTPPAGCIFCDARECQPADPLVVHRGDRVYLILNKFPYNNGHLMVVPVRHVGRLADLDTEEMRELGQLAQAAEAALTDVYHPHGFNMGLNLGRPAGAGVLDHLHLHIVPRWDGDTNFIAVVGQTRVLPEELPETARRVGEALGRRLGR
jgi:ATP adenylyltransferase